MKLVSACYLIGMWVYTIGLTIASLFIEKARLLCKGRKETWEKLKTFDATGGTVWVHAASLGEFEQGRPIIEALKAKNPNQKIVLSFYSPSGYEVRKNYNMADLVVYLPADGPRNARRFVDAINPTTVYIIKYEFWHFFLKEVWRRKTPMYGVSMIFRQQQAFFAPFGDWFRDMLRYFTHIYVQDEQSGRLLDSIKVDAYSVVGDTRFDRVEQIANSSANVPAVETFSKGAQDVLVAGSTWPPDEELLLTYINKPDTQTKLIIAPHEIDKARVDALCAKLTVPYVRYSTMKEAELTTAKVFVVDTIGILSAIYRYGNLTYVGGGFGVGIHNTLEPAIYGLPVLFGPNHKRFKEATDLIEHGGGFAIANQQELDQTIATLYAADRTALKRASQASRDYCVSMLGATDKIVSDNK